MLGSLLARAVRRLLLDAVAAGDEERDAAPPLAQPPARPAVGPDAPRRTASRPPPPVPTRARADGSRLPCVDASARSQPRLGAALLALASRRARPRPPKIDHAASTRPGSATGKVDLDSVTVTMTPAVGRRAPQRGRRSTSQRGCTGRIGRIEVTQSAGDGIKVAERRARPDDRRRQRPLPRARRPGLHQDGVQVMGGTRITFRGLDIDCGRADDRLINSNLFIRQAGKSTTPPTDVVCDGCTFGGWAAHTVSVQELGALGRDRLVALPRALPAAHARRRPGRGRPGAAASNTVRQCGPGQLTIGASTAAAVTYGRRRCFDGLFLAQALRLAGDARAPAVRRHGVRAAWRRCARTRRAAGSRARTPACETTYRARLGAVVEPERCRPRAAAGRAHARGRKRFLARVYAGRSFRGRPVALQQPVGQALGRRARTLVLGRRSTKALRVRASTAAARACASRCAAAPGYLPAVSDARSSLLDEQAAAQHEHASRARAAPAARAARR